MKIAGYRYAEMWRCVYCGAEKPSENGTGGDVSCCGEVGHVEAVEPIEAVDEFIASRDKPKEE